MFKTMEVLTERSGQCFLCSRKGPCSIKGKIPDFVVAGLPCQPWSGFRTKTKSVIGPAQHKLYKVTFGLFTDYILRVQPGAGILEQIVEFDTIFTSVDAETGAVLNESPLARLLRFLEAQGYCVDYTVASMAVFLDIPRER